MNRIKPILIVFVLIASISIASAGTNEHGLIMSDKTWVAGSPYNVTGDVIVTYGATLTIEPGVTVNFSEGTCLWIGGTSPAKRGKLFAEGTSDNKITFTGTTKAPGHWKGIIFGPLSDDASVIDNAIIEYGGHECWCEGGQRSANIITGGAAPTITNSTIRNSAGDGILCIGRSGLCDCNDPVITCNWITNNVNGIHTLGVTTTTWANPTIYHNNICGNTEYGVLNIKLCPQCSDPSTVNAIHNWWGANDGPSGAGAGNGDKVSTDVDYAPPLTDESSCAPIPELSSIILVAAGLLMLVGCARIGRRD